MEVAGQKVFRVKWVSFTAFQEDIDGGGCQITTTVTDINDFKFAEFMQRPRLEEAVETWRQQAT